MQSTATTRAEFTVTVDIGTTKILVYPYSGLVVFVFFGGLTATLTLQESIAVMREIKEGR